MNDEMADWHRSCTFIHQATDTSSTNISTLHQFSDSENKTKNNEEKKYIIIKTISARAPNTEHRRVRSRQGGKIKLIIIIIMIK